MLVRTPADLGAIIRERRRQLKLDQAAFAKRISVSRQWVIEIEHGHSVTAAYLWGLLPDNEQVLARWAAKFQVSARNVFALISHVGEDCAGAVQFVTPDRLYVIRRGTEDKVEWLDEADIAKRLQTLRQDHAAWRLPPDTGPLPPPPAPPTTPLLLPNGPSGIPPPRPPPDPLLKTPTGHFH